MLLSRPSLGLDIQLFKDSKGRINIRAIKLSHDTVFKTFSASSRLLSNHNPLQYLISQKSDNLLFVKKKTVHINLPYEYQYLYVKDGKLNYGNVDLLPVTEETKKREVSFEKKIRNLNFNPKKTDPFFFVSEFKKVTECLPVNIRRTRFESKIPLIDLHQHFLNLKDKNLDEFYEEFTTYYNGRYDRKRNQLNGKQLKDCGSVEEFVSIKFEYYEEYCPGMNFSEKTTDLLSKLPIEICSEMMKFRKDILNQKDPFLNHLFHVCKMFKSKLCVPILKSDRLIELNYQNHSGSSNSNSSNCFSVNMESNYEYPNRVNLSIFDEILEDEN